MYNTKDEYSSGDSSDEEDRINTTGAVPSRWYDEYPHVGYDLDGRRLLRPARADRIDDFLRRCEDPDFWRTVRDPATGQDIVLSAEDLDLVSRLRARLAPTAAAEEQAYEPWVEWFSREVLAAPVRSFPDHKRSFLPSREEQKHVSRLVHALRCGWTKTNKQLAEERRRRKEKRFYNLWGASEDKERAGPRHLPAPRRPAPSHAESYNPPPEYLLDSRETREWDALERTPWRRKYTFLPTRHASLRAVPAYPRFVRERFLRCLDLYLAPRAIKMRLTIDPQELVPQLPAPRDLRPFPTTESLQLSAHRGLVRAVDFDPSGRYLLSAGEDRTVKVWETSSGRCVRTYPLLDAVRCAVWSPVPSLALIAAAVGPTLVFLAAVTDRRTADRNDELLQTAPDKPDTRWETVDEVRWARGERLVVRHEDPVRQISWHARGDYVCVVCDSPAGAARALQVHQLSRRRSQQPLARTRGLVQDARFHTHRPHLYVATQRVVRIYDVSKQQQLRVLRPGAQWISAIALHPGGDNLLVASYDRKCLWFDLELSARPYRTLRLHGGAVRSVSFHPRYPLFATAGDDRHVVVSHATVYSDLLQNPLLVPLKRLPFGTEPAAPGPDSDATLCVLSVRFHPTQPWLAAGGADGTVRLYT